MKTHLQKAICRQMCFAVHLVMIVSLKAFLGLLILQLPIFGGLRRTLARIWTMILALHSCWLIQRKDVFVLIK